MPINNAQVRVSVANTLAHPGKIAACQISNSGKWAFHVGLVG